MRPSKILGFIFILSIASPCQDGQATISGHVQDRRGEGIAHARARLLPETSQGRLADAEADETGAYLFSSIPPGEYTIRLEAPGFAQLAVRSLWVAASAHKVLPPVKLSVANIACQEIVPSMPFASLLSHGKVVRFGAKFDWTPGRRTNLPNQSAMPV